MGKWQKWVTQILLLIVYEVMGIGGIEGHTKRVARLKELEGEAYGADIG